MATINKKGAPGIDTVGAIGDICVDLLTGDQYELISKITVHNDENSADKYYVWKKISESSGGGEGGGGGSSTTPSIMVDSVSGKSFILEVVNEKLVMKEV